MSQLHDPSRLVGRSVLLVESGTTTAAHVVAAGSGGITLTLGGEQRFIRRDEMDGLELDADDTHVADAVDW